MVGLLALPAGGCAARNATCRTGLTATSSRRRRSRSTDSSTHMTPSNPSVPRGFARVAPNSLNKPTEVLVYLDDNRLGGVQTLKQVVASQIVHDPVHRWTDSDRPVGTRPRAGRDPGRHALLSTGVLIPGRLLRLTSTDRRAGRDRRARQPPLQRAPVRPGLVRRGRAHQRCVRRCRAAAHSTPLFVSSADFPGVRRAASDLRADVERVTGSRTTAGHRTRCLARAKWSSSAPLVAVR